MDLGNGFEELSTPQINTMSDRDLLIFLISANTQIRRDIKKICIAQCATELTVGEHTTTIAVLSSTCQNRVGERHDLNESLQDAKTRIGAIEEQIKGYKNRFLGGYQLWVFLIALATFVLVIIGRLYDIGILKPGGIP